MSARKRTSKKQSADNKVVRLEARTREAAERTRAAKEGARLAKLQAKEARKLFKQAKQVAKRAKFELQALSGKLKSLLSGVADRRSADSTLESKQGVQGKKGRRKVIPRRGIAAARAR